MPITYTCAICNERYQSLLLDRKSAIAEVGSNIMKHVQKQHTKELSEINQDTAKASLLAGSLISFNRLILLDENDLQSQEDMEKIQTELLILLGFEDAEENENLIDTPKPPGKLLIMSN